MKQWVNGERTKSGATFHYDWTMATRETLSKKRRRLEELALTSITFDEDQREKVLSGDAQALMLLASAVDLCVNQMVQMIITKCAEAMCDWDGWEVKMADPKTFNSDLGL
jgi:hypothetical protein